MRKVVRRNGGTEKCWPATGDNAGESVISYNNCMFYGIKVTFS